MRRLFQILFVAPLRERFFTAWTPGHSSGLCRSWSREEKESISEQYLGRVVVKMDAVCVELRTSAEGLANALAKTEEMTNGLAGFGERFSDVISTFEKTIGGNSQFVNSVADLHALLAKTDDRHSEMVKGIGQAVTEVRKQNVTLSGHQNTVAEFMKQVQRTGDFPAQRDHRFGQSSR